MRIVIIDNYDSFTYNLYHLVTELGADVTVIRNDEFQLDDLEMYDKILLSPGPGVPSEAGLLLDVIRHYAGRKPILGVCLGEQAIAEAFGGKLINLDHVYHGIQSDIILSEKDYLFHALPNHVRVGRYHSWVVDKNELPKDLEVTAVSRDGNVMAIQHKAYDVHGIQFHPESVLTPHGKQMIKNWLDHILQDNNN